MLLFKQHHKRPILSGEKTATRRYWEKGRRAKPGSIHQCMTALFKDYFAKVKILDVYQERLGDMKRPDYQKEGGYTKKSFIEIWKQINGRYDPDDVVWVVEFKLVSPRGRS